jgi:hypothetical protein
LTAYGGIGSLNDVAFHPLNGNARNEAEADSLNRTFTDLSGEAYGLARALQRELDRPE